MKSPPKAPVHEIARRLLDGQNYKDVARDLSCSSVWVGHVARRQGLPLNRTVNATIAAQILRSYVITQGDLSILSRTYSQAESNIKRLVDLQAAALRAVPTPS